MNVLCLIVVCLHSMEEGRIRLPSPEQRSLLATALSAAVKAGDYFAERLHAKKQVKTKSSLSDLVTEVDPACEALIRETILAAYPTHEILGEESVAPGSEASAEAANGVAEAPHLWIVDPLDGTTNFVYSIPLSTVSIGYAEAGQLVVGVIYDPYRNEVFYAVRGQGAHRADTDEIVSWLSQTDAVLPGVDMSVSATETIEEAVVSSGFPTRGDMRHRTTEAGLLLTSRVKNLRALGSAALHLAYVSAGRLDAFWEYDLNAWDLAAGVLLVTEAGGVACDISQAAYTLRTRHIVAAGTSSLANALAEAVYFGDVKG